MSIQKPTGNQRAERQATQGIPAKLTGRDNGGRVMPGKKDWLVDLLVVVAILITVAILNRVAMGEERMSLENGWAQARAIYQQHGKLTDFLQPKCEQDVTTRNGWLEAYRHWWITGTVPPTRPPEPVETPWNVETWPIKPWENAEYQSENNFTKSVPDYISLPYDPELYEFLGWTSKVVNYIQCGYTPGSICFQHPQSGVAHPYCVIGVEIAI